MLVIVEGSFLCPCFLLVVCYVECQNEVKVEGWKPVHSGKVLAQWVDPVHLLFQENATPPRTGCKYSTRSSDPLTNTCLVWIKFQPVQ